MLAALNAELQSHCRKYAIVPPDCDADDDALDPDEYADPDEYEVR